MPVHNFRLNGVAGVFTFLWLLCISFVVSAQTAPTPSTSKLSEAEIRAKYQNCPSGYYSGPRPGKTYYTKDQWVWAVTPQFARSFCMPPEFVSAELKGAEAIAYKMVEDQDEERCGWGGSSEVCTKRTEHRFEIYFRNGTIPKKNDIPYFHAANLSSKMLISVTDYQRREKIKSLKAKPRFGALGAFDSQQFGLQAVNGDSIVWPLGTLGQEIYYEEVFQGIDYLALEGASGFSRLEGWTKSNIRRLAITVRSPNVQLDRRKSYEMSLDEFQLVIDLPQSMADQIISNDQKRGMDLKALAERAFVK